MLLFHYIHTQEFIIYKNINQYTLSGRKIQRIKIFCFYLVQCESPILFFSLQIILKNTRQTHSFICRLNQKQMKLVIVVLTKKVPKSIVKIFDSFKVFTFEIAFKNEMKIIIFMRSEISTENTAQIQTELKNVDFIKQLRKLIFAFVVIICKFQSI